jgi:hypothetical protein
MLGVDFVSPELAGFVTREENRPPRFSLYRSNIGLLQHTANRLQASELRCTVRFQGSLGRGQVAILSSFGLGEDFTGRFFET